MPSLTFQVRSMFAAHATRDGSRREGTIGPYCMRSARVMILLALSAASCARLTKNNPYTKAGATYNDYLLDRQACFGQSMNEANTCSNGGLFTSCMVIKGWERVESGGFQPPPGGAVTVCPGTQR